MQEPLGHALAADVDGARLHDLGTSGATVLDDVTDDQLCRAAAQVDHEQVFLGVHVAGGAGEREPRLALARDDPRCHAVAGEQLQELVAVLGVAARAASPSQ